MELLTNNTEQQMSVRPAESHMESGHRTTFIEANTIASSFGRYKKDHIIPVFVKDNEP
ncbi:MAG: hypothetical protein IPP39_00010 [Chitinophagaceae bacterium]|nr:hypothetical protein [Chitinophagaceae bacterium]